MPFSVNIDTSHFANNFTVSNSITIQQPPIHYLLLMSNLSFIPKYDFN